MNSQKKGYWHQEIEYPAYADPVDNNWLVKVGEACYVSNLQRNVFPVDWALDIAQIPATIKELTIDREYSILVISDDVWIPFDSLYPKIRENCLFSGIIKSFDEYKISGDQAEKLLS